MQLIRQLKTVYGIGKPRAIGITNFHHHTHQMTRWIPTTPNPDGSITIKGKTYKVTSSEHEPHEGYVLVCDENHSGDIYFTAEVAAKYGLKTG